MELERWIKVFDRLLPRSPAWGLVIDRMLRKFFHGLSILPKTIYEHLQSVLLEAFPLETTRLSDWSEQFGSPELLAPEEIEAEWGAFGGQSPQYIQDVLHAAGFTNLFVHEWWVPDSVPPVARNPFDWDGLGVEESNLIETSFVLVNDVTHVEKNYLYQFGHKPNHDQFVGDGTVSFGAYSGYILVPKRYPCPDVPEEYPVYWYICDATWPHKVYIDQTKLRTLMRLIYKMKPVHTRVILRVIPQPTEGDYDIQDTYWHDDQWQDTTDDDDEVQDKK